MSYGNKYKQVPFQPKTHGSMREPVYGGMTMADFRLQV
jgi:hypothetical protein